MPRCLPISPQAETRAACDDPSPVQGRFATQPAQHVVLGDLHAVAARLLGRLDGRGDTGTPAQ